jgi:ornithine cyclodeaminase/alanine dehydrogenase-like protein (mu-crystallin family)
MLIFDATTGFAAALLLDNGYLTNLRTGATGAVGEELGEVIIGQVPGRTDEQQSTVCDLTGVGVQDVAIATLAYQKAPNRGLGEVAEGK